MNKKINNYVTMVNLFIVLQYLYYVTNFNVEGLYVKFPELLDFFCDGFQRFASLILIAIIGKKSLGKKSRFQMLLELSPVIFILISYALVEKVYTQKVFYYLDKVKAADLGEIEENILRTVSYLYFF